MSSASFQIYNASAGSGKTYTLVKEYLKILLVDDYAHHFKTVLAVTFTNKAVHEMKERVLLHLKTLSDKDITTHPSPMCAALCEELRITPEIVYQRAAKVLKHLLHNYAFFDIVTIDKFNHRLLRTFAYDIKIPANFEVALDTELLLDEAVVRLIDSAGEDKLLTKILVDFALEKADDDKSWDIAIDLKKIAHLLLEENHYEHVEQLKEKTLHNFLNLSETLKVTIREEEKKIKTEAEAILACIEEHHLKDFDFVRGTLPNHFKKIASGDFNNLYSNQLEKNLSDGNLYTKSLSKDKALAIDSLLPKLSTAYHQLKKAVFRLKFLQNFYKNIVPLSLLNAIRNEVERLKAAQNVVLISEFNSLISKTIANQPAPFIYERLGEKYRHYFIDEFQDTSQMQWENLKPLVSNALESETLSGKRGTLCIMGDAKQAIYRWRGGEPEQFINLCNDDNPFHVEKEVISLPKNYRSFDEIIKFNNTFFQHSASLLTHSDYCDLYKNKSFQETNEKKGGLVTLAFVEKEDDSDDTYCRLVLNYINEAINKGYAYGDICILTRKKKEGEAIAKYLLENNITIVSSETLLLKNHPKIDFLINLILFLLQPKNKETQLKMLHFLATKENVIEKHDFFIAYLHNFTLILNKYQFNDMLFSQLPFYDAVEYAITLFGLAEASDAYLQCFLDEIMDFVLKKGGGLSNFIDYWEKKKDSLSVVAPKIGDAIQLMTIHKAKGLEFPVVIYPFANTYVYEEQDPKLWFPLNEADYGISSALLNKNKDIGELNDEGFKIYNELQSKLELDQFNILYVALTRAIERLYIITKKDVNSKGEEKLNYFSGLFIHYLKIMLLWDDAKTEYRFGTNEKKLPKQKETYSETIPFITHPVLNERFKIAAKAGSLWDTPQQKAMKQGNLYHYLLSKIKFASDIDAVMNDVIKNGTIPPLQEKEYHAKLNAIVNHKMLENYFTPSYTIYNERDIYTRLGEIIRPDRIAVDNNKATIIDYKTGFFTEDDVTQLHRYAKVVKEMNMIVENLLLVFINNDIEVMAV